MTTQGTRIGTWPEETKLAEVKVQKAEPIERTIRRFRRKVEQAGILKEYRRHSFYLKPGERRRQKHARALKRKRRSERRNR